jgi:nitrate reductase alpha subunit
MKVMAQMSMVMNLDKCIGCHTCSVTCKQAWTNRNGVVVARAIVSHRMPEGTVYMYHAKDRTVDVPRTETSGQRGGIHNSLTRILLKPSHLIGGYAQLSFAFNYLGPTGNQRDEVTVIRRRSQEVEY